jgi:peptidoglycan hydrolase-like protein with peptidoglycan-binding domain
VQQSLNKLGAKPPLEEDGINGPETMSMVRRFQLRTISKSTALLGRKRSARSRSISSASKINRLRPRKRVEALRKALG